MRKRMTSDDGMERPQAPQQEMPAVKKAAWLAGVTLLLTLLMGCSFLPQKGAAPEGTPTRVASELFIPAVPFPAASIATMVPIDEPGTGGEGIRIVEHSRQQEVATGTLIYTIEVELPLLEAAAGGELGDAAAGWNYLMENEAGRIERDFIQAVSALPEDMAALGPGNSFLSIMPKLVYSDTQTLSVLLAIHTYMAGAAHPGTVHRSYNYNMLVGELYSWSDVFKPGIEETDYLQVIASACVAKLKAQPGVDLEQGGWLFPEFETAGAAPTRENYRVWNITGEGLLVTFEEYQIAPYAAGPQQVLLSRSDLAGWLSPEGPLGDTSGG